MLGSLRLTKIQTIGDFPYSQGAITQKIYDV
jgi:hypothetical protein